MFLSVPAATEQCIILTSPAADFGGRTYSRQESFVSTSELSVDQSPSEEKALKIIPCIFSLNGY
jgi:hypothetical protein